MKTGNKAVRSIPNIGYKVEPLITFMFRNSFSYYSKNVFNHANKRFGDDSGTVFFSQTLCFGFRDAQEEHDVEHSG